MDRSVLMQIPVTQRLRKQNEDGEVEEVTRVVPELIAPYHIVRVSPTENGTVIWLAHGAPYVETPMTYPQLLEQLQSLQVEENVSTDEDSAR